MVNEFVASDAQPAMTRAQRLKCWHLKATGDHIVTSIARMPGLLAKTTARTIWGQRIWREYQIPASADGRELLFIHIPKCAGTSVAQLFKSPTFPHFPAYAFQFTDEPRFRAATRFAIIRDPAERLASVMMHFRGSMFSTRREHAISADLAIDEKNIDALVRRLATDVQFEKYLFGETHAGLAGFNVPQADWLYWKRTLLVDRVYAMSRLDRMAEWLNETLQEEISIPHANSSGHKGKLELSAETRAAVEARFPRDAALWAELQRHDGVLIRE